MSKFNFMSYKFISSNIVNLFHKAIILSMNIRKKLNKDMKKFNELTEKAIDNLPTTGKY